MEWLVSPISTTALAALFPPPGCTVPTEQELCLVETLAQALAARSFCLRCGAALGRGLLIYPCRTEESWSLVAATRCRGWRRHLHIAVVTDDGTDLRFGQFWLR